jgi:hypothetical protein
MTLCLPGEQTFSDSGASEVCEVPRSERLNGILRPGQKLRMVQLARRLGSRLVPKASTPTFEPNRSID